MGRHYRHLVLIVAITSKILNIVTSQDLGCFPLEFTIGGAASFGLSPGSYDQNAMTVALCRDMCTRILASFAGLRGGSYCFCDTVAPTSTPAALCNIPCSGDAGSFCGGLDYITVWASGATYTMLQLIPGSGTTVFDTYGTQSYTISYEDRPDNREYRLEVRSPAFTTVGVRTTDDPPTFVVYFSMSGRQVVTLYAVDAMDPNGAESIASSTVDVVAEIRSITVECPLIWITDEYIDCNSTIVEGSDITAAISYGDGYSENVEVTDPLRFGIGSTFMALDNTVSDLATAAGTYYPRAAVAGYDGKLVAIEYVASAASGTFDVLLLAPTCTAPPYCLATDTCAVCDPPDEDTCTAPDEFSPFCDECGAAGAACTVPVAGVHDAPLEVVWTHTVTITQLGYNTEVLAEADFPDVLQGYLLAVSHAGVSVLSTVDHGAPTTTYSETNVLSAIAQTSGALTQQNFDVMVRGVASRPAIIRLYHKYAEKGVYPVTVTAKNTRNPTPGVVGAVIPDVIILEGVNISMFQHDEYMATNIPNRFVVDPHSGCAPDPPANPTPCTYTWYIDLVPDPPVQNTPDLIHTFTAPGAYNVCLTIANQMDSEFNCSTVILQDNITGLTVTPTPFYAETNVATNFDIDFLTGTDANCSWSVVTGPVTGLDTFYTSYLTAPGGTAITESLTFTETGEYDLEIECRNEISSETDTTVVIFPVHDPITNIVLAPPDPQYVEIDQPYDFTADSDGSYVEFDWTYGDGSALESESGTEIVATSRFESTMTHTFTAEAAALTLTVVARNALPNTEPASKTITVQIPVPPDLIVSSDSPTQIDNGAPGTVVTFTVSLPPGPVPEPSTTSVTLEYADGSPNETVAIPAGGFPFDVATHQLTVQGEYNITVHVFNEVSSVSTDIEVGVYHELMDVAFDVTPLEPPSYQMQPGEYPMEIIIITVSSVGNLLDHFTNFKMSYVKTDGTYPGEEEAVTAPFNVEFIKDGDYHLELNASNPVSFQLYPMDISMIGGIRNMHLIQPDDVAENEPMQLQVTFESFGGQSCVFVNFGDGVDPAYFSSVEMRSDCIAEYRAKYEYDFPYTYHGVITNPLDSSALIHTYPGQGSWDGVVYGLDVGEDGMQRDLLVITISDLDCHAPVITFPQLSQERQAPDEHKASDDIVIAAKLELNCKYTLVNKRQWRIYSVIDPLNIILDEEEELTDADGQDQATLVINKESLAYGDYRVDLTCFMANDTYRNVTFPAGILYISTESMYIRVIASDLISNMLSNPLSSVQVGVNQEFCIKPGSYARDPDIPPDGPQGFTGYAYGYQEYNTEPALNSPTTTCEPSVLNDGVNSDPGGPFQGVTQNNFLLGEVCIDMSQLDPTKYYVFCTTVEKGSRNASSMLLLDPDPLDQPITTFQCESPDLCEHTSTGVSVAPTQDLVLSASCSDSCPVPESAMEFEWTVEYFDPGPPEAWVTIPNIQNLITGQGTGKVVIDQAAFAGYENVRVGFAMPTDGDPAAETGFTTMIITLNQPPDGCNPVLDPNDNGQFLLDTFILNITDCYDPEGAGMDNLVTYYAERGSERLLVGSTRWSGLSTMLVGGVDPVPMSISAVTRDLDGVSIEIPLGTVTVMPADLDDVRVTALGNESMDRMEMLQYTGNLEAEFDFVATVISASNILADINNRILFDGAENNCEDSGGVTFQCSVLPHLLDGTPDDIDEDVFQEYQDERDSIALSNQAAAYAIGNSTTATVPQAIMKASTVGQLSANPEHLLRDTQVSLVTTMVQCGNVIMDRLDEMSPEQITQIATDLLSASASLQTGCVVCMNNSVPLDTYQQTPNYDTDLENIEAPRFADPSDYNTPESLAQTNLAQKTWQQYSEQRDSCKWQNEMLTQVTEQAVHALCTILPQGEQFNLTTNLMSMVVSSFPIAELQATEYHQLLEAEVEFTLPPLGELQTSGNVGNTIYIGSIVDAYNTLLYAATNHQYLPFNSRVLKLDLSTSGGDAGDYRQLPVVGAEELISMYISRDAPVPPPNETYAAPLCPLPDDLYMVYHSLDIVNENSSLTMWLKSPRQAASYLLVWMVGSPPNITSGEYDYAEMVTLSNTADPDGNYEVKVQFGTDLVAGRMTRAYVAIRELSLADLDSLADEIAANNTFSATRGMEVHSNMLDGVANCSLNYTMLLIETPCYFLRDNQQDLVVNGCVDGPESSMERQHCLCSHLTGFTGGFSVAPNPIDWNAVLNNASFLENPTIYSCFIVIFLLYIIIGIWARRKDRKDVERIGIAPLADNDPLDHYYYEVIVQTGRKNNSGTHSKVFFLLTGLWDETGVRELKDEKRTTFSRGATDYFLLATPRPLGKLHYLRVWHDNSGKGKNQSWFLTYIIIHDLHTRQKYHFVCNKWLAVERDDGSIDRLLPVADRDSMASFGLLFSEKTNKDMSDSHIWFSVIGRPAISRFTRLQRVTCCLCVLVTAMMANIMFYAQDTGDANSVFTIGPFALSPQQISIGLISNLITFPINFIIAYLFRDSKMRRKRKSRVTTAVEKNKAQSKVKRKDSERSNDQMALLSDENGMIPYELEERSVSTVSLGYNTVTPPPMPPGDEEDPEGLPKKKKKKFQFPWWGIIIAWILSFLTVLVCTTFTIFYGLTYGDVKTQKWLSSMMISFISSVLLTQPIKVVLAAAFFALIFKKPSDDDADETEMDEEPYELAYDEEWLHPTKDSGYVSPQRIAYRPPDPRRLEKARARRLKEIQMMDVIKEILLYCIFLWVLMIVSYDIRQSNAFKIKDNLVKVFVAEGATGPADLNNVQTLEQFWYYVHVTLTAGLRADTWYNGQEPYGQRGFMSDRLSRMMGFAVMRQVRVKPNTCSIPDPMDTLMYECNEKYSTGAEDTESYGFDGWFTGVNGTCDGVRHEYCYNTWSELDGYPWMGQYAVYNGGGYVAQMRGSLETLRVYTTRMKRMGWVDKYTRAVFTEFSIYNAYVNLFAVVTILAEKLQTGGFLISYRVEPMNLLPTYDSSFLFVVCCQAFFCLFVLFFLGRLIRDIYRQRCNFFKGFWNFVELSIVVLSISSIVIFIYRYFVAKTLTTFFAETHGNAYMKMQYVAQWAELLQYLVGVVVFLSTLKFLLLLRFNKRMSMLGATLAESSANLTAFSFMFSVFFFAFMCLFYGVLGSLIYSYATLIITAETLLNVMLGKFDYYELRQAGGVGAAVMFLVYVCVMAFIILNMFVSILNESFEAVSGDVSKQKNDYEIVDFMVYRFKALFGIEGRRPDDDDDLGAIDRNLTLEEQNRRHYGLQDMEQLPERIDEFLDRVTDLYFPGDPLNFKQKSKTATANDNRQYTDSERKMFMKELENNDTEKY